MEIEKLKKIIIDQKEDIDEFFRQESIIERDLNINKLKKNLSHPNILVISGVRRSGKSTLSLLLLKGKKYGHINFDDERLAGFNKNDFNDLLQAFYELYGEKIEYFIFDEIQNIAGWEIFASRLRKTKKIIITGSNANLLAGELATHLTGRYIDFHLYPFSFKEFLRFKNKNFKPNDFYSTKKVAQIKRYLAEYIEIGGFPEVFKFGKVMVKKIYEDIIIKDSLLRYNIKNKTTFKEMANYLISNFSQEMSYAKLANIFAIKNVHTAKNYVDYLSSSFLIFALKKFSYKLKQQVIAPKKIYGIDSGLINSLAWQFSQNYGRLMENIVFLELLRRQSYLDDDWQIFYWQDYSNHEVDFVLKKGKLVNQLIQVCHNMSMGQTREREIKSLLKGSEELRCDNLLIITFDNEGEEKAAGKKIKFIPLFKFLLD